MFLRLEEAYVLVAHVRDLSLKRPGQKDHMVKTTLVNIASSKPVCVTQQETVPREKRKAVGVGRSLAPSKCQARSLGETLSPTSSTVKGRGNEKRERGRDRWTSLLT